MAKMRYLKKFNQTSGGRQMMSEVKRLGNLKVKAESAKPKLKS